MVLAQFRRAMTEMCPLDGIEVAMAMDAETVVANVVANIARQLPGIESLPEFRKFVPLALVGGGPSLNRTHKALARYRYVMACGSVHDHLVDLGVTPNWTLVIDPDPVMARYLTKPLRKCKYLIASYCDDSVFEALSGYDVFVWHPSGGGIDFAKLGAVACPEIGGGCTVGTRALNVGLCFGFEHIHLYGFDTCISDRDTHHAYSFATDGEDIGPVETIQLEPDGRKFLVPGYLLAQLYDFKTLIEQYKGPLELRVAGGGVIDELLKVASKHRELKSNG